MSTETHNKPLYPHLMNIYNASMNFTHILLAAFTVNCYIAFEAQR